MKLRYLLRALGLKVFAFCIPHPKKGRSKSQAEPLKPVTQSSLSIALIRCCIHILPVLVSIVVISLNLKHIFLGRDIPGVLMSNTVSNAVFQIIAKLQELLIIGSLGTVVFHVIRQELLFGHGIPFGLLGSGFNFSELSFFWSGEFWGSLRATIPISRKIYLVSLLVAVGLIAATAGPSSAVLLVPRSQSWDGGGSSFYMQQQWANLFPRVLQSNPSVAGYAICNATSNVGLAVCPSGGLVPLQMYTANFPMVMNGDNLQVPYQIFGTFAEQTVSIASNVPSVPSLNIWGYIRGVSCQTSTVGGYLPVSIYQNQLVDDWWQVVGNISYSSEKLPDISLTQYEWSSSLSSSVDTNIPAVRTICTPAQNISQSSRNLLVPVLPSDSCPHEFMPVSNLPLQTEPVDRIRTTWMETLSPDLGSVSANLIFEAPWTDNNRSRVIVACSVDARWANGTNDGTGGSVKSMSSPNLWQPQAFLNNNFRPVSNSSSWESITLDKSWLQSLTPTLSYTGVNGGGSAANVTTLEDLLSHTSIIDQALVDSEDQTMTWNHVAFGSANRTIYLEWILSLLVTDGLSRHAVPNAFNMTGPPSQWRLLDYTRKSEFGNQILRNGNALERPSLFNGTTFRLKISIEGLSYRAQAITDFLSIAVLLGHMVLALVHTVVILFRHQSSECWNTVPEMLALALRSRGIHQALTNCSAGIQHLRTYAKIVKIYATEDLDSSQDEAAPNASHSRVELVFSDEAEDSPRQESSSSSSLPENSDLDDGYTTSATAKSATWPLMAMNLNMPKSSVAESFTSSPMDDDRPRTVMEQPVLGNNITVRKRQVQVDRFYG